MSDATQQALVIAAAPTLLAIGTLITSVLNGIKANRVVAKADTIIEKAVEIHTLTNSNLNKITSALEVANEKIQGLQKLIGEMGESKKAADTARTDVAAALASPVPHAPSGSSKR